jgi:hypothetical protein
MEVAPLEIEIESLYAAYMYVAYLHCLSLSCKLVVHENIHGYIQL